MDFSLRLLPIHAYCIPIRSSEAFFGIHHFRALLLGGS
mgnify:CR=1 FL=1